jgi:hypothetical protein
MTTFTANDAFVGMPATFGIGTDRYATEVIGVYRFKSGAKAGQVKAVEVQFFGMFTLRTTGRKAGRLIREGGSHGSLRLGVAEDYRDPHF